MLSVLQRFEAPNMSNSLMQVYPEFLEEVSFITLHLVLLRKIFQCCVTCWESDLYGTYSHFESPHCSHRLCYKRRSSLALWRDMRKWGARYLLRWGLMGAAKEKVQKEVLVQNILNISSCHCIKDLLKGNVHTQLYKHSNCHTVKHSLALSRAVLHVPQQTTQACTQ